MISKIFNTSYVMNTDQSEWAPGIGELGLGSPCWPLFMLWLLAGGRPEGSIGRRPGQQKDIQDSWGKGYLSMTTEIFHYFDNHCGCFCV